MSERRYYSQDAEQEAVKERNMLMMMTLATGFVLGAIVSILFAPQKGQKIRGELMGSAGESMSKTVSMLQDSVNTLHKKVDTLNPMS